MGLFKKLFILSCLSAVLISCEELAPEGPPEYVVLDGPLPGLNNTQLKRHSAGDEIFSDEVFTEEDGLGPVFVSNRCANCHVGEGKGHPFDQFVRFGQSEPGHDNPYADFGDGRNELQNKALPGYEPQEIPEGAPYAKFIAPSVTGLGYIDAVPDQQLLDLADPDDANGDGISGRPQYDYPPAYSTHRPNSVPRGEKYIFRFGKKSVTYRLLHQTADAFNQDMGITSSYQPIDPFDGKPTEPEADDNQIKQIVYYLKTLKAPPRRNEDDPEVKAGEEIFSSIDCAKCHTPTLTTGPSDIPQLAHKTFHPYSDILLHNMGPELDDGYTESFAETDEWRTAPLWGIGLSARSQGGKMYLLHDGRANSIDEAIMYHGGEAENSKTMYDELSEEKKQKLITFIKSL